jgi:sugar lactone lactonase YvrE
MPQAKAKGEPNGGRRAARIRPRKLVDARFADHEVPLVTGGVWDYAELTGDRHRDWFNDWISFDCLLADDRRNLVWCGLTRLNTDNFWAYDRARGEFRSLGFSKIANRFDAKFHRSLVEDRSGVIWAATALLHEIDRWEEAPGGAIVRFDPNTEELAVVARPLPHLYIQSLQIDRQRGLLYGQTYTPEMFFVYDLNGGQCRTLGPLGSGVALGQSEQLAIDRRGAVWGSYGVGRAWSYARGPTEFRLWRYHPDDGRRMFDYGLPAQDDPKRFVKADGVCAGPDGAVYMGTAEGTLCRIDPESFQVELLGKPAPGRRLAGMAVGPDGWLYGSCGRDGSANLFRYDPANRELVNLGPIFDPDCGQQAWQIHDMTITADGTIYAGENDVPYRSGYLWEISGYIEA